MTGNEKRKRLSTSQTQRDAQIRDADLRNRDSCDSVIGEAVDNVRSDWAVSVRL